MARLLEPGDDDDTPIVKAILALAQHIGIDVVAEGMEHAESMDVLRGLKCHIGQGYLFSPPADPAASTTLIRSGSSYAVTAT